MSLFEVGGRVGQTEYIGMGGQRMETRVAIIGIIVDGNEHTEELNQLLHEYGAYILGRMGIPYRKRGINIISVAMDAPQDVINSLAGKVGRLNGISAKTVYSKNMYPAE